MALNDEIMEYHEKTHLDISIKSTVRSQSGLYQCTAETALDAAEAGVTEVIVRKQLTVAVNMTKVETVEGADISVHCSYDSDIDQNNITWYKDNHLMTVTTHVLSLKSITTKESGLYMCKVTNRLQSVTSANVDVKVYKSTQLEIVPSSTNILVGGGLKLECIILLDDNIMLSESHLHWMKDGEVIQEIHNPSELNIYQVDDVKKADEGEYGCMVETWLETSVSDTSLVNIFYPMNVTKQPQNTRVAEGTDVRMECEAEVDPLLNSQTSLSWFKDDILLLPQRNLSDVVLVKDISLSDSGVYSCQIENFLEKKIIKAVLDVEEKFNVSIKSKYNSYLDGEDLELDCSTENETGKSFSWFKNGILIENETESILMKTESKIDDTGLYKCVISTDIDKSEGEILIDVLRRTKIIFEEETEEERDLLVLTGSKHLLNCTFSVDPKLSNSLKIIWKKNNETFLSTQQIEKVIKLL